MKCKDCPHLVKTECFENCEHWNLYCKKHDITHCPVTKANLKYLGCVEDEKENRNERRKS